MSTIGYQSWAVDLAEVGAIYPFQGYEVLMTVFGVGFWRGGPGVQFHNENEELKENSKSVTNSKKIS